MTARNARTASAVSILKNSIEDIKKGHWVCGDLCSWEGVAGATKKADVKPMACAVGLVALFAGHTNTLTLKIKGRSVNFETAVYPARKTSAGNVISDGGLKTLQYLYLAIPEDSRKDLSESGSHTDNVWAASVGSLESVVIDYNDGNLGAGESGAKNALKWFEKALRLAVAFES